MPMSEKPARQFNKTAKNTPRGTKSQLAPPPNTIAQKVSVINKKIKSFFFGAKALNTDQDSRPEVEVQADYNIPTLAKQEKAAEDTHFKKTPKKTS